MKSLEKVTEMIKALEDYAREKPEAVMEELDLSCADSGFISFKFDDVLFSLAYKDEANEMISMAHLGLLPGCDNGADRTLALTKIMQENYSLAENDQGTLGLYEEDEAVCLSRLFSVPRINGDSFVKVVTDQCKVALCCRKYLDIPADFVAAV